MNVRQQSALIAALATMAVGEAALGQDTADEALEEIVVTGSRIARSGFDTPTPTTVISSAEIERTGLNDIGQVLLQTPQIGIGVGVTNDNFNRDIGSSFINLRSLGVARTLVLIDGRRRVSGSRAGSQVDLTAIPAAMIESVEVITGGASAIYGADAVSGVVNVKLKKNFEGLVLDARGGMAERGDGDSLTVSLLGGGLFADEKGSANFGLTYQEDRPIFQRDRSYTFGPGNMTWVGNPDNTGPNDGIPDRIILPDPHIITIGYEPTFVVDGTRRFFDGDSGGLQTIDTSNCVGSVCSGGPYGYNSKERLLRSPREVFSAISTVDYEIAQGITAFAGLDFSFAETVTNGQSFFDSSLTMQRENPTLPAEVTALMDANGLTTLNIGIQQEDQLGNKEYENTRYTYSAHGGLRGTIAERFDWEAFYQYGRRAQHYQLGNTRIESRFFEAMDVILDPVSNTPVCRDAAAVAAGCLPIDLFAPGPVPESVKEYFKYAYTRDVTNEQTLAGLQLSGKLFELPAGDVGIAAGAEYRKDTLASLDDGLGARGLLYRTDNGGGQVRASTDVIEVFAEVVAPILSDKPFAEELTVEAALRWSDYDTIGSTLAWKLGASWSPVDSLRFRLTQSQSVRAPNILELFGPESRGTLNITADPCDVTQIDLVPNREANCRALGIPLGWEDPASSLALLTILGGNETLSEEESDSWSAGLVFRPEFVSGLRLSLDYWSIDITDAVQTINGNTTVDNCVDSETIDNAFCPLVTRGNLIGLDDAFVISRIDLRQINVGSLNAAGIDFAADYVLPLDDIVNNWSGDLGIRLSLVNLLKLEELVDPVDPSSLIINDGEYGDPHWRGNLEFSYALNDLNVNWKLRYVGDSRIDVQRSAEFYSPDRVPQTFYSDLYASYDLPSETRLYAGVNNMFDRHPPRNPSTHRGVFSGSHYDNIGRYFYFGARVYF